jgi:hypothetical protein
MRSRSRACLAPAAVVFLGGLALTPLPARAYDDKGINPGTSCTAYAPDTTAAELQFTPTGVYNPGTVVEKVLCQIPRDQEAAYTNGQLTVIVVYRVIGGTPSKVTCTLFIGSTAQQSEPVYTNTAAGNMVSSGTRAQLTLTGATSNSFAWPVSSTALVCNLPAKTWIGGIYMEELGTTDYAPG